jgi:uncharacterized protein YaaQ
MKLLLAIVQDQDAGPVVSALVDEEYRVTRINTHGGFLRRGNATLLIGADDDQVDPIIKVIDRHTAARESDDSGVQIGAGTVFVLPIGLSIRV